MIMSKQVKSSALWTMAIAVLWSVNVAALAQEKATIKNKDFDPGGKEMDASVAIVKINGEPMEGVSDEVQVAAGEQRVQVVCTSRLFVGMGTMDIAKEVDLTVDLKKGRTYKLGARLSEKGDCMPTIE
jgi:hypothetical protein